MKDIDLPARFTIERISTPDAPSRYLTIADDGSKVWASARAPFSVFASAAAASDYHRFRMAHYADARVVRHTVH